MVIKGNAIGYSFPNDGGIRNKVRTTTGKPIIGKIIFLIPYTFNFTVPLPPNHNQAVTHTHHPSSVHPSTPNLK